MTNLLLGANDKFSIKYSKVFKARKAAKIRNQYNQVRPLTQNTTWVVTKTQLNITNKGQEVSPFHEDDYKAALSRH